MALGSAGFLYPLKLEDALKGQDGIRHGKLYFPVLELLLYLTLL